MTSFAIPPRKVRSRCVAKLLLKGRNQLFDVASNHTRLVAYAPEPLPGGSFVTDCNRVESERAKDQWVFRLCLKGEMKFLQRLLGPIGCIQSHAQFDVRICFRRPQSDGLPILFYRVVESSLSLKLLRIHSVQTGRVGTMCKPLRENPLGTSRITRR